MAEGSNLPAVRTDADITSDIERIMSGQNIDVENNEEAQRSIVESILRSDDIAAVFATRTTTATKDLIDKELVIRGYRLREGEVEGQPAGYMLLDCAHLESGEVFVANTSAPNIMATLMWCEHHGVMPVECKVVKVGRARRGENAPLGLEPVGKTLAEIEKAKKAKP